MKYTDQIGRCFEKHLENVHSNSGIIIIRPNMPNIYFQLATHLAILTMLWVMHISTRDTVKQSRKIIYTYIQRDKDGKSIK